MPECRSKALGSRVIENSHNGVKTSVPNYCVVVVDIGLVYQGKSLSEAVKYYGDYVLRSINRDTGFARKTITLLQDDIIVMKYEWPE